MWWLASISVSILALGGSWFWANRRVAKERQQFRTAIHRQQLELWPGLLWGIVASVITSGIAVSLGVMLPQAIGLGLMGISAVTFLLGGLTFSPAWLGLAGLVYFWPGLQLGINWIPGFASLIGLIALAQAALIRFGRVPVASPFVRESNRGRLVGGYRFRQFFWFPLVLPIPGSWFAALPFWNTLHITAPRFSLICLPIILGASFASRKQLPDAAWRFWPRQFLFGALMAFAISGLAYFDVLEASWSLGLLAVAALLLGVSLWRTHFKGQPQLTQTESGVRLLAVVPNTPAAKMGLVAGDLVLTVNGLAVSDNASLYAAVQSSPTYARLKVAQLDGEIKLTEAAIFEGAPHELGMITFPEETHQ
ncbi:PDZ domain-containing protein [Lacticaseibacillus brantae]|uniref:Trypsin-like serine protease with PDZ domain n=1 Tax=Lacticaseibacillus brantae DSM 23927 TaxID=1423727 RepID=A0A0R2B7B5_9LACO|nr:PDZ domain-containing protein [Lacticaseibacillus brantae]KRM72347.1 trypsin-like serine protease with PDZ domain [Lacticaseibacillus brantae DSM 23927]